MLEKKEFYDTRDAIDPNELTRGDLLNHQEFMARFLSSYTLYDECLVFHAAGTGKTCTAIGSIERILSQGIGGIRPIKRALVLVKSVELAQKFMRELVYVCTEGQYEPDIDRRPEDSDSKHEARIRRKIRANIAPFYQITTYETFYNRILEKMHPSYWRKQFSNHIIVIDEIHQLSQSRMYDAYWQFLHELENRKILLMSGTPARDDPSEIARVMNLILPKTEQIPARRHEFTSEFLTTTTTIMNDGSSFEIQQFKSDAKQKITRALTGRVSYLRADTGIRTIFQGVPLYSNVIGIGPIVVKSPMSAFQYHGYLEAVQNDNELLNVSQSASLFVYPDSTYGPNGFLTNVSESKTGGMKPSNSLKESFSGFSRETNRFKLNQIAIWSAKYKSIIESIIESPTQNVFIFSESIRGSGAIILGLCLEQFGFQRINRVNGNLSPRPRYAILSERAGVVDVESIVQAFNRKSNANGKFIRILIGGRKVGEGFTFRNIQQIHVTQPHWNMAVIDQAIARGVRFRSHRNLPPNTPVRVFLHVSTQPDMNTGIPLRSTEMTDTRIYTVAYQKDFLLKTVEQWIKTIAVDCTLQWTRNASARGVRDDLITTEQYICANLPNTIVPPYTLESSQLLTDTHDLFYVSDTILDKIIPFLQAVFRLHYSITLNEIIEYLESSSELRCTAMQLMRALHLILIRHVQFIDRYGFPNTLHEDRNVFYLARDPFSVYSTDAIYAEFPAVKPSESFKSIIQSVQASSIERDLEYFQGLQDDEKLAMYNTLPISIKRHMLETAIIGLAKYQSQSDLDEQEIQNTFVSRLVNHMNQYVVSLPLGSISSISYPQTLMTVGLPIRVINHITENKVNQDQNVEDADDDVLEAWTRIFLDNATENIFGRDIQGIFSIVDIRPIQNPTIQQIIKRGKVCNTYSKGALLEIGITLGIISDNEESKVLAKAQLCQILRQGFESLGLIQYM